jgi:hypothetical protein
MKQRLRRGEGIPVLKEKESLCVWLLKEKECGLAVEEERQSKSQKLAALVLF